MADRLFIPRGENLDDYLPQKRAVIWGAGSIKLAAVDEDEVAIFDNDGFSWQDYARLQEEREKGPAQNKLYEMCRKYILAARHQEKAKNLGKCAAITTAPSFLAATVLTDAAESARAAFTHAEWAERQARAYTAQHAQDIRASAQEHYGQGMLYAGITFIAAAAIALPLALIGKRWYHARKGKTLQAAGDRALQELEDMKYTHANTHFQKQ